MGFALSSKGIGPMFEDEWPDKIKKEYTGMNVVADREYVFTFGVHKGDHIDDVLKDNPGYIVWCIENLEWFSATEMVEKLAIDNLVRKKESRR